MFILQTCMLHFLVDCIIYFQYIFLFLSIYQYPNSQVTYLQFGKLKATVWCWCAAMPSTAFFFFTSYRFLVFPIEWKHSMTIIWKKRRDGTCETIIDGIVVVVQRILFCFLILVFNSPNRLMLMEMVPLIMRSSYQPLCTWIDWRRKTTYSKLLNILIRTTAGNFTSNFAWTCSANLDCFHLISSLFKSFYADT